MANNVYMVNESRAISETLDNETIIINLDTGNYYSANKTASLIWNQIKLRSSIQKIFQNLFNHFDVDKGVLERSINETVVFLLKNNLIVESKDDVLTDDLTEELKQVSKEPFVEPKVEKYDDMKEMLLADPIHDVGEDGWPNLR